MLTWLDKASSPVDHEASLAPMDTCQSSLSAYDKNWLLPAPVYWMRTPDIIKNDKKNNRNNNVKIVI
jgi:hypothetical protein